MAQKEQMTVKFERVDNGMKPRFVNGQEIPDWEHGVDMVVFVQNLNAEGWQMTKKEKGDVYHFEKERPPQRA